MPLTTAGDAPVPKPFSLSLGSKKPVAGPALNIKKRPHSSLADDGSDEEDEGRGETQLVFGFDNSAGGVISNKGNEPKAPLVIAGQKNKGWQAEAERKRGKNILPAEELARRAGAIHTHDAPGVEEKERTWGLVVHKREEDILDAGTTVDTSNKVASAGGQPQSKEKTADEEALEALIGGEKKDNGLVIPNAAASNERLAPRTTERDLFKSGVASGPDVASLDAYNAIPVESFGLALMRGMGWREGEEIGRNRGATIKKKAERRPAGLGIGAKEVPEDLEREGGWGKTITKTKKAETRYEPFLMKNPKTGEALTEEDLKARKEREALLVEDVWKARRERDPSKDEERKAERRHRGRGGDSDDYSSGRHISKRDRSSSPRHKAGRDRDGGRDRGYERDRARRKDANSDDNRRGHVRERDRDREMYRGREKDHYDSRYRRDRKDYDDRKSDSRRHRDYDDDRHRHRSSKLNDRD